MLDYDLVIDFGFCGVKIIDKGLTYSFKGDFTREVNDTKFEDKIKKAVIPTDSFWKTSSQEKWGKSTYDR